jgi:DNA-binding phage protein
VPKLKDVDSLSREDRAELRAILKRLDQAQKEQKQARLAFARFARRAGMSAVARELGVSKQAVFARIGAAKHNTAKHKADTGR